MRGIVSFHPIDTDFYGDLVQPLIAGERVNPESWLADALRLRIASWQAARYVDVLEDLIDRLEPPPAPEGSRLWDRVRTRLERFDFRPPRGSVLAASSVEPDLHLYGRPFLIAESSPDRVSALIDEFRRADSPPEIDSLALEQLVRLHPELPQHVELAASGSPATDQAATNQHLKAMKAVFDLATAAREDRPWSGPGGSRSARDVIRDELPWMTLVLHSRAVPYWIARDVDGLESICLAAGIAPPDVLAPAWALFGDALDTFPELTEGLGTELTREHQIGAFVSPDDVPELLAFLAREGARIIKAAGRHGEGATCEILLRKIRECLRFAELHGMGYLEAAGLPVLPER